MIAAVAGEWKRSVFARHSRRARPIARFTNDAILSSPVGTLALFESAAARLARLFRKSFKFILNSSGTFFRNLVHGASPANRLCRDSGNDGERLSRLRDHCSCRGDGSASDTDSWEYDHSRRQPDVVFNLYGLFLIALLVDRPIRILKSVIL